MAMKQIPYGLTDFERIRLSNYYYVDKTRYIAEVEKSASFFFLIRPRRFGKSLFLNVLRWYYDINRKDRFQELFGDLYIGSHPTEEQGKYLVLGFNFAGVNPDPDQLLRSFNSHCAARFREFAYSYESFFSPDFPEELERRENADDKLNYLIGEAKRFDLPIYLFIDEYDNFTNAILANMGDKHYRALTHGTGFFRYFFNKLKEGATGEGPIKRMFITGVSPVTMDDVTSGFNIGSNMSTHPSFNGIIGFSEEEVRKMLTYYKEETGFEDEVDDLLDIMKPWYDNYCFSNGCQNEPMYNSDMALYFVFHYLLVHHAPENMIDNNVRTDYNKLRHLIRVDKQFGMNASIIQEIINNGETTAVIKTAFPAEELTRPDNFKSLLYYFGLLTIKGMRRGDTLLGIPNLTVREQLYSYLISAYQEADMFNLQLYELHELVKSMAYDGDWKPVFEYFSAELKRQSAIREFIEGEAHVKGFLLAYLGMMRAYIIFPEYEAGKGYADFYMMPDLLHQPEIAYSYIVEVKYAKRDATQTEIDALNAEAALQLKRYADDPKVHQTKGETQLLLVTLVFKGWELAVCDACPDNRKEGPQTHP
ncbi:MAG: AAA family ATPase [Parabacteroides sp.]|nr:AAA family ATPase [Parabacteroides sp.]